jgi:diacylglycerol O-acyltransferase
LRWRLAGVPLGLHHPYWVDGGTVDIDHHVREITLPSPGDQCELAEEVARLIASHLERARPLWELYVIHGLQDGAVAVLIKMHHATNQIQRVVMARALLG